MAYNTFFPQTYSPVYYPQAPQVQTAQPQNSITWVSGEAGAKAYLVAPNTTAQLWDSERQSIYLKSADSSGMPTMKILDYTIRETTPEGPAVNPLPMSDYVTKAELSEFEKKIKEMIAKAEKEDSDEQPFV